MAPSSVVEGAIPLATSISNGQSSHFYIFLGGTHPSPSLPSRLSSEMRPEKVERMKRAASSQQTCHSPDRTNQELAAARSSQTRSKHKDKGQGRHYCAHCRIVQGVKYNWLQRAEEKTTGGYSGRNTWQVLTIFEDQIACFCGLDAKLDRKRGGEGVHKCARQRSVSVYGQARWHMAGPCMVRLRHLALRVKPPPPPNTHTLVPPH